MALTLAQAKALSQDKLTNDVIDELSNGNKLDDKFKDHELHGDWEGYRECHIQSDWLLIYKIDNKELILTSV